MYRLSLIIRDTLSFLILRRNIHFYFSTLNIIDCLLALLYSACVALRLPVARQGCATFSKEVKKYFGPGDVFFYSSARSALCGLLRSLQLEPESEVIVSGFTCEVVPNAVIQAGLCPVYADIEKNNFSISPEALRNVITNKTRVLIIQHTFGIPADLDSLMPIAREHGLYVIEDCAVSLGSHYKGMLTGTFGDAAIFSFELSKTITSCRGGMLLINTNKLECNEKHKKYFQTIPEQRPAYSSNILFQLGLSGILYRPVIINLGKYFTYLMFKIGIFKYSTPNAEQHARMSENYMMKLSDQQAVLLKRQWSRLDKICEHSKTTSMYYLNNFQHNKMLVPFKIKNDDLINLIRYPILVDNRVQLIELFKKSRIELGLWFTAPLSSPMIKHELFGYDYGMCPTAENIVKKIINLPVHLHVKKKDMDRIISILRRQDVNM